MADKKISEESDAGALTGTEQVRLARSGANFRTTVQAIADLATSGSGSNLVDLKLDFGAAIDGVTDDLTHVNAALAAPHVNVFVQEGTALVSAKPTDSYGPEVGPGLVLYPVTSGHVQANTHQDRSQHTFGEEYLDAIRRKFSARGSATIRLCGDSTTSGVSISNTAYLMDYVLNQALIEKGFTATIVNAGHSGVSTDQWVSTYLAGDISAAPDLMVVRYGINDPSFNKPGDSAANTANNWDAEQGHRRSAVDFAVSLRAALTSMRAAKSVSQQSILLMMPNCTSDSPNGRDEKWYETIRGVMKRAARDFQCCFIDTYSMWFGARGSAGIWMDNIVGGGIAIHPLENMNLWIASVMADVLVPNALALRNALDGFATPAITDLPNSYPLGQSSRRCTWTVMGTVMDGAVKTYRNASGVIWQEVIKYNGFASPARRVGRGDTNVWMPWVSAPSFDASASLSNSWVVIGGGSGKEPRFQLSDGIVTVTGRISNGATPKDTVICTIPPECVPAFDCYRTCMFGSTLSQTGNVIASALTGKLLVGLCTDNTYFDIGITYSIF